MTHDTFSATAGWRSARWRSLATLTLCAAVMTSAPACRDDNPDDSGGGDAPQEQEPAPADDRGALEVNDFEPGPMAMRRLTRGQYISTVKALFGNTLTVLPPTEVDIRVEGLLTVGASTASITPAGMERYEASARQIAGEVLSPERRERVLDCAPEDVAAPDDECARRFIEGTAPGVLRRALRDGEADVYVGVARTATETVGDFYRGLEAVLSGWLLSPDFLFIQERAHPRDAERDEYGARLTGVTLASRLSYFLWSQGPDGELLEAALNGELDTDEGYEAQVERLLADEGRLKVGVRALFIDLYDMEKLARAEKDPVAYPQFTNNVLEDAREQTLRTIIDHLVTRRADYRDLFTTRETFITRALGPLYNLPVAEDWQPTTFTENGPRAGILSHVSFLALQARSTRSSPVLRGNFVLEALLCTTIPPPPADVNFEAIAPESGSGATARDRLAVHRADPACAGCHDLIDPIGLAFENFDAVGQFRTEENGQTIETHGDLFGEPFVDVRGFYATLRDSPLLTPCIVRQLYSHAVGRPTVDEERPLLQALNRDFAQDDHDFVALMRTIALTHGFRATSGPREADAPDTQE